MKRKIPAIIKLLISFWQKNLTKFFFIFVVHIFFFGLKDLPYVNVYQDFLLLVIFIDWLLIVILFTPSKRFVWVLGFLILVFAFPFMLFKENQISEVLAVSSFILFFTALILEARSLVKEG